MKLLRMKPEYIEMTKRGEKIATTRLKLKVGKMAESFELVSGPRYKPKKSGIVIKILFCWKWTERMLMPEHMSWVRGTILRAEGFTTWEDFMETIKKLNKGKKITSDTIFYTHFFGVVLKN